MTTHKIEFSTSMELCADSNGLREIPSGTSPHNPNQTRFVFRNAEVSGPYINADFSSKVAALADADNKAGLIALLRAETMPVGRAAESRGWI